MGAYSICLNITNFINRVDSHATLEQLYPQKLNASLEQHEYNIPNDIPGICLQWNKVFCRHITDNISVLPAICWAHA